jgi:Flavin containing amine oxidoreductase
VLGGSFQGRSGRAPPPSAPPLHRRSSDVSVDNAVGKAILNHKLSEFALLSDEERCMLTWNMKNVEYALGANVKDLSMKFWDIDERHAFEGDHVLLRQGYSTVIDHLHRLLKQRGDRFSYILDFPVGKLEYNRKTSTQPYISMQQRNRKFVDLSDTCCVTSQDNSQGIKCDFVVSAVPLGVLKASTRDDSHGLKIAFRPPLPFVKRDAIESVGFGLLNKAYLQFPFAFWTTEDILGPDQTQFGNASGINPHHYMFLDVGKTLGPAAGSPAILMSLISGSEAAACEQMTQRAVVEEIVRTLRTIFSKIVVPDPIAFKVTRWGSDQFSRGSYTFLAPGTTDEDFETLQSPVNGNGDSLLLEGSETMRLFFAGEHTTALHPSMAHGAMRKLLR